MEGLRLQNLRSFEDTGQLSIKPITILVGQNSSGKSTLLRSLPLISQSVSTNSNSPILWFGDYVDFGSVGEVRSKFSNGDVVSIEFALRIKQGDAIFSARAGISGASELFWVRLDLAEVDEKTQLRSFRLKSEANELTIHLDRRGTIKSAMLDGQEMGELLPSDSYKITTTDVIPQILNRPSAISARRRSNDPYNLKVDEAIREIRAMVRANIHAATLPDKVSAISSFIKYSASNRFLEEIAGRFSHISTFRRWIERLQEGQKPQSLKKLRGLALIANLREILRMLQRRLEVSANSLSYISPTRATGERYYRLQELAIDKIDPQGRNVPMFLHSLTPTKLQQFSEWLNLSIGYRIKVDRSAGHIQVLLSRGTSDDYFNLADMGYGFSQVLPIMAQIWSRSLRRSSARGAQELIVAIEQPELHLHPAYQSMLADTFAKSIGKLDGQESSVRLKFVIETHSESLLNRLGELIEDGALSKEDVIIYIVEKDAGDQISSIREAKFDDQGLMNDWPVGFFSAAE